MKYYFVRANGETGHNNPSIPDAYVPGEPPQYPEKEFDYYDYCLKNNVIRIGWPGTGDIKKLNREGALDRLYSAEPLDTLHMNYLLEFSAISLGDIVLMPNKKNPGQLSIGEINTPYRYFHDIPRHPYECAHRLGIKWDVNINGKYAIYYAKKIGINIGGGWWRKAFHCINDQKIIEAIRSERKNLQI